MPRVEEFQGRFIQRLRGLAASHDLLVEADWRGARLHDLIRQQLAPFAEIGARLQVNGPDVVLAAPVAQTIGLALHELATNATKPQRVTCSPRQSMQQRMQQRACAQGSLAQQLPARQQAGFNG